MIDFDHFGYQHNRVALSEIADMFSPVRCASCRGVYDLGKVEVTARYTNCSVWKAPCCGRVADDRGETGWKSTRDYYPIDKRTGQRR